MKVRNVYFAYGIDIWHFGVVSTLSVERHAVVIEETPGGLLIAPTPAKLHPGETLVFRTFVPWHNVKSIVYFPDANAAPVVQPSHPEVEERKGWSPEQVAAQMAKVAAAQVDAAHEASIPTGPKAKATK